MTSTIRSMLGIGLIATIVTSATAQGAGGGRGAGTSARIGWTSAFQCTQCTVHVDPSGYWVEYGTEPVVRGAAVGSVLHDGDALVAVEGRLITTPVAGRILALANADNPHSTQLAIRRNGRLMDVIIPQNVIFSFDSAGRPIFASVSDSMIAAVKWARDHESIAGARAGSAARAAKGLPTCLAASEIALVFMTARTATASPAPFCDATGRTSSGFEPGSNGAPVWQFGTFEPATVGLTGSSPIGYQIGSFGFSDKPVYTATGAEGDTSHTEMNLATTRGWLGLALDCLRCSVDREDRSGSDHTVRFTTPPVVVAVEPGAASLAGFKVGDIIRSIDGNAMTSAAGATRFSSLRAGERVPFVVERNKQVMSLTLVVPKPE